MFSNTLNSPMPAKLSRAAEVLARAIRARGPTRRIRENVTVGPVQSPSAGSMRIDVSVKAPEAFAYEFGSGIHRPENPGTYVISPKEKSMLAFFWDKVDKNSPVGNKFRGISKETGKALFTFVDHPGVAAKPYDRPAIEETKDEIREIIGQGFTIALQAELGEIFKVD